jgi:hypothetical protein
VIDPPPEYLIRLRPLPGSEWGPIAVRVRRSLKVLLWAFGLKCVGIEEVIANQTPATANTSGNRAGSDLPHPTDEDPALR